MYIILKKYADGKHVVVLDGNDEVLEYEKKEKAEDLASIFRNNDPKHEYVVKKIGEKSH